MEPCRFSTCSSQKSDATWPDFHLPGGAAREDGGIATWQPRGEQMEPGLPVNPTEH
jgi:hypothetical protein